MLEGKLWLACSEGCGEKVVIRFKVRPVGKDYRRLFDLAAAKGWDVSTVSVSTGMEIACPDCSGNAHDKPPRELPSKRRRGREV